MLHILEQLDARVAALEAAPAISSPPARHHASGMSKQDALPPSVPRVREHAEVSTHLIAVWGVLLYATEPLSNHEIARTGQYLSSVQHVRIRAIWVIWGWSMS